MFKRIAIVAAALAIVAAMASTASAAAANVVTVGADLNEPMAPVGDCETANGCGIFALTATPPSSGTAAPFDGTVTSWRIGGANANAGYTISVLHENSDGTYTVTASASPVTPAGGALEAFAADLPIHAGEYVALDIPEGGTISVLGSASDLIGFVGPLKIGETLTPFEEEEASVTFAFDAEVESLPAPPLLPALSPPSTASPGPAPISGPPAVEGPRCVVPKLTGKKPAAAKRALRRADCGVGLVVRGPSRKDPAGKRARVRAQAPKPGKSLPPGTEVSFKLG